MSLPSGFQNSDQTLMVPALAVAAPDGSVGYFDVKLRFVAGGATLGFVVSSIADTAIGRTVAGPAGPQGPAGPAGADGSSGGTPGPAVSGLAQYGHIYNLGAQVVPIEADVVFDTNGTLQGLTHAAGTSAITVGTAGVYDITFSVSGVEPNQFAVFVNGSVAPGSLHGSGAGTQQNRGSAFLTLTAGDVVTLRNHSSAAAVTLQTLAGGTQINVNASIRLLRLN